MKYFGFFLVLVSASAFAFPGLFGENYLPKAKNPPPPMGCVNFDGNWKGECSTVVNGVAQKHSTEISIMQSDCEAFYLGGQPFSLNGIKNTSISDELQTSSNLSDVSWNDRKSMQFLVVKGTFRSKRFLPMRSYLGESSGTLEIKDGKLLSQYQWTSGTNGVIDQKGSQVCQLLKQ